MAVERYKENTLDTVINGLRTTTIIPAYQRSSWRADSEVDAIHFYIDDHVLRNVAEQELGISGSRVEVIDKMGIDDSFIKSFAPIVLEEMKGRYQSSKLILDSFDIILACHLLRNYSNVADAMHTTLKKDTGQQDKRLIEKAKGYILENLSQNIGIGEVATFVGVSNFHFARVFKNTLGLSPYQYLTDQRVTTARNLLEKTDTALSDIAYDCGFCNQAHFTTVFGKRMGVTPAEYRRAIVN